MDVMRCVSSTLGTLEPEEDMSPKSKLGQRGPVQIAIRLTALFGPALLYWHHFHRSGLRIDAYTGKDTIAENFCKLMSLSNEVEPLIVKTVDTSLILYAEHDFNASTFAARVTASTRADFYSAITTAIGTLRGNLHGGANEAAMEFLSQFSSVKEADDKLRQMFSNK